MEFQDQLPCGGYEQQDQKIQQNLQKLSLQSQGHKTIDKCDKNSQCNCNCDCNSQCKCKCKIKPKIQQQKQQQQQHNPTKKKHIPCKKCKQNQAILLHKNQVICRQCLMKNIQYKTRLTLQNKIKVRGQAKILLCFSGGLNSICLVNIMKNIRNRYKKNPLFGGLECLHIQQQTTLPDNYIQKFEELTALKLHIIPIQKIYKQKQVDYMHIYKLFKNMPLSANSIDLLQLFRDKLILDFGRDHGFDFIMLGKNGETLAAQMFKYFTKGIGGSSGQLCSNQEGPFDFPLRQHLQKQLQYYFYSEKLGNLAMFASQDDLSNIVSKQIDDILNNFIANLQDRYSHTAPAIVRTGERLIRKKQGNIRNCKWCFLQHKEEYELCQKCWRFHQNIRDINLLEQFPKWMQQ